MARPAILHYDYSMDDDVGTVLARERFRLYRSEIPDGNWNNSGPARWSQNGVGRRLGITAAALSMWESGRHHPATLKSWHDWAGVYNRSLASVIAEVEKMREEAR